MGFLDYNKIKMLSIAMVGFVPLFAMTIAMGGLRFNWLGGAGVGIASLIIMIVIGKTMLDGNSFVRAIQKEGILLFNLNSTGLVPTAIARIKQNKFGQKLFAFKQGDEEVTRLYDRDVAWTLKQPLEGTYEIFKHKETGKKLIRIEIEEDSFSKSVFFSDYLQCLFFNEQDGNFLTKQELCEHEKSKTIQYLTLNEQRELREMTHTLRDFMRNYADRLAQVGAGMVGNPSFKIIIVILIVVAIGAAIWFMNPMGIQQMVMDAPAKIVPNVSGLPSAPIN